MQEVPKEDLVDLVRMVGEIKNFSSMRVLGKVHTTIDFLKMDLGQQVSNEEVYGIVLSYVVHLQIQFFFNQTTEINSRAQLECSENSLQLLLIPKDVLRKDLQELAFNISRDGYEVALRLA